jgi:hypothetical protein
VELKRPSTRFEFLLRTIKRFGRRPPATGRKRSHLRRLLTEQLEQRQLLAAYLPGDSLAMAMLVGVPVNPQTEVNQTIGDGGYGSTGVESNPFQNVRLVSDTGANYNDKLTIDPRVQGNIVGDFGSANLTVEFDHNQDGRVDGRISVNALEKSFQYDPRTFDTTFAQRIGNIKIGYRLEIASSAAQKISLPWNTFDFAMESVPVSFFMLQNGNDF